MKAVLNLALKAVLNLALKAVLNVAFEAVLHLAFKAVWIHCGMCSEAALKAVLNVFSVLLIGCLLAL